MNKRGSIIMKIQGPHLNHINAYKNQLQKNRESPYNKHRKDQLNISPEAKQLQQTKKMNNKRSEYVQQIKNEVESGKYKINYERTAQKITDFWSKY